MEHLLKKYLYILTAAFLTACNGGKGNQGSTMADSTVVGHDSTRVQTTEITRLPDTAYASVAAVKFTTEIIDTASSGIISTLEDMYSDTPGAFTFRKNAHRDGDFNGRVFGTPEKITVDWEFKTDVDTRETKFGTWGGGSGWTGQPLYVNWPDSCISRFKGNGAWTPDFDRQEIIVGSLASRIYFINFNTGKPSRKPIHTDNPIKGTVSLDPTLNGNLYAGQGVPAVRPFGAMVIDLYKHQRSHFFGEDAKAGRHWDAYDSSPLRVGQFLIRPGENGTLYKFTILSGSLKLHSTLRYTVNGLTPGMEASISVYRNYGFTADNHGNVLCVNLDTMKPVWHYSLGDDTDATPVIQVENGKPYIYTGCEIDRQNVGAATFVKLNGLDSSLVWEAKIPGKRFDIGNKHFDGGFYASALPGDGNCKDMIFTNCVTNEGNQGGDFIALNRHNGSIVYRIKLKHYAWSSPVGFLNENGEMFIFTGDTFGNVYLINGIDGKIIHTTHVGNNFESSPVAVGNSVVVGSRGNSIYKMTIQ